MKKYQTRARRWKKHFSVYLHTGGVRAEKEVIPSQSTPASGLSGAGMQSHQHTRVKQEGGKPDGKYLSVFLVFLLHQLSSPNSQPLRNKGDNWRSNLKCSRFRLKRFDGKPKRRKQKASKRSEQSRHWQCRQSVWWRRKFLKNQDWTNLSLMAVSPTQKAAGHPIPPCTWGAKTAHIPNTYCS